MRAQGCHQLTLRLHPQLLLLLVKGSIKTVQIPLDVALIQTSPPDSDGNLNLGIGVDITRAAIESASTVIAQINSHMPRVQGDGAISRDDIDFAVPWDEPLMEYLEAVPERRQRR